MNKHIDNMRIAISQFWNALLNGNPDEMICGRVYKYHRDTWIHKLLDFIFGKDHCKNSVEWDE